MNTSYLHPFIRHAHLIPIDEHTPFSSRIAYDHRFFFVYEKEAEIIAAGTQYHLSSGDVMIIHSGIEYRIGNCTHGTLLGINFDFTNVHRYKSTPIPLSTKDTFDETLILEKNTHPIAEEGVSVIRGMHKCEARLYSMLVEYTEGVLYYNDMLSHLFSEVLIECMRGADGSAEGGTDTASRIIGYVNENASSHLTNEAIAEKFGLHPNYASAIVKERTGMSLHKYLMKTRVYYSIDLLQTGKHTIREVAEACGFSDIYHFSKVFKKFTGLPPSRYVK